MTNIELEEVAATDWELLVVGAGPAGAVAALELARRGRRVLLVDKRPFPRDKVCGSCLSQRALNVLQSVGLGDMPVRLGGRSYDHFRICSQGVTAKVKLPRGIALTRSALDDGLAQAAVHDGAFFMPGTRAQLGPLVDDRRQVTLSQNEQETTVTSRVVIAADGVGGQLLRKEHEIEFRTWRNSRIGAGIVIHDETNAYPPGAIHMAVARHGYVGLVRAEHNYLTVAAALDANFVRRHGGVATAVEAVLRENELPSSRALQTAAWRGTGPLTRQIVRPVATRLFAIGDAAGYVEPFTGEGMAWAMSSARIVAPHAVAAVESWTSETASSWIAAYRRELRAGQQTCFHLARLLRYPWLVRHAVSAIARFPGLAQPLLRRLDRQGI